MSEHPEIAGTQLSHEMSSFEFTLITLFYGFSRWVEKCMEAGGPRGLGALDILVLHAANHRARGRSLNEIAMALNIDDTHLVGYSLKKLIAAGLVTAGREGRHRGYEATPAGDAACAAYKDVRERYLIASLRHLRDDTASVASAGELLRILTGMYDQAGRFATADAAGRPAVTPVRTKR